VALINYPAYRKKTDRNRPRIATDPDQLECARMASEANAQRIIEDRILARHRLIAERLLADPSLIEHARSNLRRWAEGGAAEARPAWYTEWRAILDRPIGDIVAVLTERSEHAAWLRSCSPFAGMLSARERWLLLKEPRHAQG
jgi:hypothetical protein